MAAEDWIKLWRQHLRALGFSLPDEADKQAQYERRVADLRAQVHTRQPKAESKAVVWE